MQQAIFWVLIGLVCLSPLPLASNRPLPWSLLALGVGGLLVLWGGSRLFQPRPAMGFGSGQRDSSSGNGSERSLNNYSVAFCLGFALLLGWYGLQISPYSARFAHPAWAEAATALGEPLIGAISVEPTAGLTLLMKILAYGGIFIMALYFGRERYRARTIFLAVAFSSAAYSAYGLFMHFSGTRLVLWFPKTEYVDSLTSTFINRNSFATFAAIGVISALGPILHEFRRLVVGWPGWLRSLQSVSEAGSGVLYLLMVCVVLNLAALILTGSRGGLVSFVIGLLVFLVLMTVLREIRMRQFITLLVVTAAVLFGFISVGGSFLGRRMGGDLTAAPEARIDLFHVERLAVLERPLIGGGLGSFPAAFDRANDGSAIYDTAWVDLAHNSYLELAIEGGLIGLGGSLILLGLMVGILLRGVFTRGRSTSFAIAGVACCAIVGTHALVDFSFQMPAVAATFMLLVGAAAGQSLAGAVSITQHERLRQANAPIGDQRRGRQVLSGSAPAIEEVLRPVNRTDDLRRLAAELEALVTAHKKPPLAPAPAEASPPPAEAPPPPEPAAPVVERSVAKAYKLPRFRGDRESS
jgi:O-antigen ligase